MVLKSMEEEGRSNVREEASAIFESLVLEDIAQGRAPTGPGLPAAAKEPAGGGEKVGEDSAPPDAPPAFYMKCVIVQGRKSG